MKKAAIVFILPSLVLGALGGFFVGNTLAKSTTPQLSHSRTLSGSRPDENKTLRDVFLSRDRGGVDYEKLARVCLTAADRTKKGAGVQASAFADPNSPEVNRSKENLDQLISVSMESGIWSRAAGFGARRLMQKLPATDVAEFESLLRTIIERGDLQPQPGAWYPRELN